MCNASPSEFASSAAASYLLPLPPRRSAATVSSGACKGKHLKEDVAMEHNQKNYFKVVQKSSATTEVLLELHQLLTYVHEKIERTFGNEDVLGGLRPPDDNTESS
ncbi:hypothetical protein ZWY2020_005465 [Hordeum vulgare]|nr:hypothetical protein ZWY2020_005465 [Hordeum vulgare]